MFRAPARRLLPFFFLSVLALSGLSCRPARAPDDLGPVGPFSLTERSGQTITDKDLLDKVWVASFVFVRCTGPCPRVTTTMQRLQGELTQRDIRLVTFTVDPQRDQPRELRIYADNHNADPE